MSGCRMLQSSHTQQTHLATVSGGWTAVAHVQKILNSNISWKYFDWCHKVTSCHIHPVSGARWCSVCFLLDDSSYLSHGIRDSKSLPYVRCVRCKPKHIQTFCLRNFFKNLSLTFSLSQASIVTVIRLVNDAVDTIESEGIIFHPLFSLEFFLFVVSVLFMKYLTHPNCQIISIHMM